MTTPHYRKTRCTTGDCVEVAHHNGHILMRNSRTPNGTVLTFTPDKWAAFTAGIRDGEFDNLTEPEGTH